MEIFSLISHYALWHYTRAVRDIVGVSGNFIWFVYHFFSIPVLLKTFFAPWKQMTEVYGKGLQNFFTALAINTLMRIVGVLLRSIILVVGFLGLVASFLVSVTVFVLWFFVPVIFIVLIGQSVGELLLFVNF